MNQAARCLRCQEGSACPLHPDGPPEGMFPSVGTSLAGEIKELTDRAAIAESKYQELFIRVDDLLNERHRAQAATDIGGLNKLLRKLDDLKDFLDGTPTATPPPVEKKRRRRTSKPKPPVDPDDRDKKCGCAHDVTCEHCGPVTATEVLTRGTTKF